jgi:hypothetical protein
MNKRILELLKEKELLRRRLNTIQFSHDTLAYRIILIRQQSAIDDELNLYSDREILTAKTKQRYIEKVKRKIYFHEIEEEEEETLLDILLMYILLKNHNYTNFLMLGISPTRTERKKRMIKIIN